MSRTSRRRNGLALWQVFVTRTSRTSFRQFGSTRSIREEINSADQTSIYAAIHGAPKSPGLFRPLLFTLSIGFGAFGGAAYLTRRDSENAARRTGKADPVMGEMWDVRRKGEVDSTNETIRRWKRLGVPAPVIKSYAWLQLQWLNSTDGQKVGMGLIAANAVVFLAWQIPVVTVSTFMMKHFMHYPMSGRSYTLLTSAFSHKSFFHFAFNMMALQSFVRESSWYIGSRQAYDRNFQGLGGSDFFTMKDLNSSYHILAFFLTAGVVAGFGSHVSTVIKLARVKDIASLTAVRDGILPSLGASGAIYGTLALTALAIPLNNIYLLFLPGVPIPIGYGALGIMTLDAVGILRGWRMFDHWAHLSGAGFGVAYFYGGPYVGVKPQD